MLTPSITELDKEEEDMPIIAPWSTVTTTSSPLVAASSLLAEGSIVVMPEPASLFPNYKKWSVFGCHGFNWLIGGTESWGDWRACITMSVDFRIQAGFLVVLAYEN